MASTQRRLSHRTGADLGLRQKSGILALLNKVIRLCLRNSNLAQAILINAANERTN